MSKIMKATSIIAFMLTIIFSIFFNINGNDLFYTLAITFGTISYHFIIRLIIGYLINFIFNNKIDYNKSWFKIKKFEIKLYKILKVKKWKDKMPTYDPSTFDISKHTLDELLMAMCQSELVHETIFIFSFLPILAAIWFGSLLTFIITSFLAALFDLSFVIMQRFNRNRIQKLKTRR